MSGALARAGMPTVPGLPRRSCPGRLSMVVSGQRAKVGAARSPEPCLEVVHPHRQVLLAKANQKGRPDSRGGENKLHPLGGKAAKNVRLFLIHHMMWEKVAFPDGESAILGSTKSLCRRNRAK